MNSKKKAFLSTIAIVFIFTLILTLLVNFLLISYFGLNKSNFVYIIIPLSVVSLSIFLFLINSLMKNLFKSDESLQKSLRETIHELNIPVSTINMNVQLLEKNIHDEKSKKRLNRIKLASNSLLKLYEQMEYDIKKQIDNVDTKQVELSKLIESSLEKFEDIKNDTKIDLNIDNITIEVDQNGFEKTIDNLISNAIKYNNKEKPYINIYTKDNHFCIYNNGLNIDTKNLFIVFDEYYQANPKEDGFGLGLAIVKEFCDKNKIDIKIQTNDEGNTFCLDFVNIRVK